MTRPEHGDVFLAALAALILAALLLCLEQQMKTRVGLALLEEHCYRAGQKILGMMLVACTDIRKSKPILSCQCARLLIEGITVQTFCKFPPHFFAFDALHEKGFCSLKTTLFKFPQICSFLDCRGGSKFERLHCANLIVVLVRIQQLYCIVPGCSCVCIGENL